MNMMSNSDLLEHQHAPFKSSTTGLSCCTFEKQGLDLGGFTSSSHMGTDYTTMHPQQTQDGLLTAHLRPNFKVEGGFCITQTQNHGLIQPFHQEILELPRGLLLQQFLKGSASVASSVERNNCHEPLHTFHPVLNMSNGGGFLSTSLTSGIGGRSCSLLPERSPYVTDGPWIDEARSSLIDRGFHLSEQVHAPNIQSSQHSPSQPHGSAVPASGQTRPRPRARRGQATDPHSIAERKRREKIANAMKELQELVPVLNKADRIAFVDGVIEYVKFLQLQTKVFFMSRLGTTGASLVADAAQVQNGIEAMVLNEHMDMVSAEEEIAQLLEQDIGKALQELQSKGLCIMPISLAAILRIHDDKQSLGLQNSAL